MRIDEIESEIRDTLTRLGRYDRGLDMQIKSLAGAVRTLEMANETIDNLDSVIVNKETRYGSEPAPHPVFKIQRDAQESVTKQMKALGLTTTDLQGDTESDPLVELTQKVIEAGTSKAGKVKVKK